MQESSKKRVTVKKGSRSSSIPKTSKEESNPMLNQLKAAVNCQERSQKIYDYFRRKSEAEAIIKPEFDLS